MTLTRFFWTGLLASVLTACGGGATVLVEDGGGGGTPLPVPNPFPTAPTPNCSTVGLAAAAQSRWPVVCMLTSSGEMVFELYDTYSPQTVNNFLAYTRNNYYANTIVHRVDRDFIFQGGGFTSGQREKAPLFGPLLLEDNNGLSNLRGTLAMARRRDANSATSQWFVNVRDNVDLDYTPQRRGYAVFGRLISGAAVMDAINTVPVYAYPDPRVPNDPPTDIRPRTEVLVYWVRPIQ